MNYETGWLIEFSENNNPTGYAIGNDNGTLISVPVADERAIRFAREQDARNMRHALLMIGQFKHIETVFVEHRWG